MAKCNQLTYLPFKWLKLNVRIVTVRTSCRCPLCHIIGGHDDARRGYGVRCVFVARACLPAGFFNLVRCPTPTSAPLARYIAGSRAH